MKLPVGVVRELLKRIACRAIRCGLHEADQLRCTYLSVTFGYSFNDVQRLYDRCHDWALVEESLIAAAALNRAPSLQLGRLSQVFGLAVTNLIIQEEPCS